MKKTIVTMKATLMILTMTNPPIELPSLSGQDELCVAQQYVD